MWQPSGIINPKWQVRRMLVGPQCVRSFVRGLSNENKASPTPRRAHSTASGLDARAVLVAGAALAIRKALLGVAQKDDFMPLARGD